MYLDYHVVAQSLAPSRNFLNNQILSNVVNSDINIPLYARNLYPIELHVHCLSHICQRHWESVYKKGENKLDILNNRYKQCLGEFILQKVHEIVENCQINDIINNSSLLPPILPASNIFFNEQIESALINTDKRLISTLISHWKTYNIRKDRQSRIATINLKPVDIGSQGSTFIFTHLDDKSGDDDELSFDNDKTFSLQGLDIIQNIIDKQGFVVIKNVLDSNTINKLRDCLNLDKALAKNIAFSILEEDSNVNAAKFTRGRITCFLRGTTYDTKLRQVQKFWMPILHYLMPKSITCFPHNRNILPEKSIYISWINLILSDTFSDFECWHRNNSKYGLTVVIPLDYNDEDGGRLEFIPKSHTNRNNTSYTIFQAIKNGSVGVNVRPGDLIIYNSSILHRYTMNKSLDFKSDLVYQYDYVDSVPPGQSRLNFFTNRMLAKAIIFCNKFVNIM